MKAQVTAIKRGQVMAQIKLVIPAESVMGSVITVESLEEMGLEVGDEMAGSRAGEHLQGCPDCTVRLIHER